MTKSYLAFRARIDRFVDSVKARYNEQMTCRPGCATCCQAGLTVVMVEAVVIGESLGIEEDRILLQAGQPPLSTEGTCAMLDEDELCLIYGAHPVICRTHGLPLHNVGDDYISICDKNFLYEAPHISAVLDVGNMETSLFAVNLDYCRKRGLNPMARVSIDRIAILAESVLKKRAGGG